MGVGEAGGGGGVGGGWLWAVPVVFCIAITPHEQAKSNQAWYFLILLCSVLPTGPYFGNLSDYIVREKISFVSY